MQAGRATGVRIASALAMMAYAGLYGGSCNPAIVLRLMQQLVRRSVVGSQTELTSQRPSNLAAYQRRSQDF